jgi:hypothetical protein
MFVQDGSVSRKQSLWTLGEARDDPVNDQKSFKDNCQRIFLEG